MEIDHVRQRSASHGSLQSNPRGQNRSRSQTNPRTGSQRRPLRSVNENAHLLRSPGPLESMLKTTTETGDIGLFTIKPLSSSANGQPLRRQLSHPAEDNIPRTPHRRDIGYYSDDRKLLPSSYRDTTSEIISLYGPDIYPSCSRSFSPSVDGSRRSYSLTTCSSRRIQSQKSSATLQSQSSAMALQRPRSPFPYPTRLKRPGVRPASPALTENGAVDYSKMVELDRISHRTIHGSYRPAYPPGPRRPPPLSLRADANRSTMSLPSRSSPAPHPTWSSPIRAWTPSSQPVTTANIADRDRRGSNAQSSRSASLTSIVEMYNRPMRTESSRFYGSFYYDYTEEFEEDIPPVEPAPPLCPIPQRVKGLRPPVILKDEHEEQMKEGEIELPPNDMDFMGGSQQDIPGAPSGIDPSPSIADAMKSLEGSCSPSDNTKPPEANVDSPYRDVPKEGFSYDEVSPQMEQISDIEKVDSPTPQTVPNVVPETKVTIISTPDFNQALGTPLRNVIRGHWRRSKTLPTMSELRKLTEQKRTSESSIRRFGDALDSEISEFATLLTSLDRLEKASRLKIEDRFQNSNDLACIEVGLDGYGGLERNDNVVPSKVVSPSPVERRKEGERFHKRHRRNLAALRISTTALGVAGPKSENISRDSEEIPILSPEPLSPARELRVKNSIPQLMKALPPLPGEAGLHLAKDQESISNATATDAFNESPVSAPKMNETEAGISHGCHTTPQKFKLKVRKSLTQEVNCQESQTTAVASADVGLPAPFGASPGKKKRLKIKISRTQLGKGLANSQGTVIRSPALKQCNSLADLEHCSRRDMFTKPNGIADELVPDKLEATKLALPNQFGDQTMNSPFWYSDHIRMDCPEIAKDLEGKTPSPISSVKDIRLGETPSLSSQETKPCDRGLRKKISLFRLRLGGTQSKKVRRPPTPLPFSVQETSGCALGVAIEHQMLNPPNEIASKRSGRVGIRVRKWARGAKRAVRSCVKKKLDR